MARYGVKASSGILHVCGGDPATLCGILKLSKYSPRMWR